MPEAERREAQRLLISLEMNVASFVHAAKTDDLSRTINYYEGGAAHAARGGEASAPVAGNFGRGYLTDLLKSYPMQKLTLEIKKFILPDTQYVSVRIERHAPAASH